MSLGGGGLTCCSCQPKKKISIILNYFISIFLLYKKLCNSSESSLLSKCMVSPLPVPPSTRLPGYFCTDWSWWPNQFVSIECFLLRSFSSELVTAAWLEHISPPASCKDKVWKYFSSLPLSLPLCYLHVLQLSELRESRVLFTFCRSRLEEGGEQNMTGR